MGGAPGSRNDYAYIILYVLFFHMYISTYFFVYGYISSANIYCTEFVYDRKRVSRNIPELLLKRSGSKAPAAAPQDAESRVAFPSQS